MHLRHPPAPRRDRRFRFVGIFAALTVSACGTLLGIGGDDDVVEPPPTTTVPEAAAPLETSSNNESSCSTIQPEVDAEPDPFKEDADASSKTDAPPDALPDGKACNQNDQFCGASVGCCDPTAVCYSGTCIACIGIEGACKASVTCCKYKSGTISLLCEDNPKTVIKDSRCCGAAGTPIGTVCNATTAAYCCSGTCEPTKLKCL